MKLRLKMRRYLKLIFPLLVLSRFGLYFVSIVSKDSQNRSFGSATKSLKLVSPNFFCFNVLDNSSFKCNQYTNQFPKEIKAGRNPLEILLGPTAVRPKLEMFRLFQDPEKVFLEDYCKTCALVTNSGFLIGSNAGKYIDSNQCVLRMNNGPVTGYEVDLGTRTTHR